MTATPTTRPLPGATATVQSTANLALIWQARWTLRRFAAAR